MFKNPAINFNALFNPLGNSTCSSPEVVLALLLYEGSTIQNASDQFISFVYFFLVGFAFHPSPQTKIWSVHDNFKQLYLHTHWKLDTSLYEHIYSEQSILPSLKIFTIPPETPCIMHIVSKKSLASQPPKCFLTHDGAHLETAVTYRLQILYFISSTERRLFT